MVIFLCEYFEYFFLIPDVFTQYKIVSEQSTSNHLKRQLLFDIFPVFMPSRRTVFITKVRRESLRVQFVFRLNLHTVVHTSTRFYSTSFTRRFIVFDGFPTSGTSFCSITLTKYNICYLFPRKHQTVPS